MGIVMVVGRFVQNYALLDYEEGVRELALFSLAGGIFHPFGAVLIFVPQMTNVIARDASSLRACLRFVVLGGLGVTFPVSLIAWTPLGPMVVPHIYDIGAEPVERIVLYLRFLTPLHLVAAINYFCVGLLVQAHRTGTVTAVRVANLSTLTCLLAVGLRFSWSPVTTICVSWIAAETVSLAAGASLAWRYQRYPANRTDGQPSATVANILSYFWPMSVTTCMFALTRPIIFAFVTLAYTEATVAESIIVALSLVFSFSFVFGSMINQFRHVMVTFGGDDPGGALRFMTRATIGVTGLLLLACVTPFSMWFFVELQRAPHDVAAMAWQGMWAVALWPAIMAWRNYYHGLAMVHRRTLSMAVGGILRNTTVIISCAALCAMREFNHVTASFMIVFGFASEAATVTVLVRRWRESGDLPDSDVRLPVDGDNVSDPIGD